MVDRVFSLSRQLSKSNVENEDKKKQRLNDVVEAFHLVMFAVSSKNAKKICNNIECVCVCTIIHICSQGSRECVNFSTTREEFKALTSMLNRKTTHERDGGERERERNVRSEIVVTLFLSMCIVCDVITN